MCDKFNKIGSQSWERNSLAERCIRTQGELMRDKEHESPRALHRADGRAAQRPWDEDKNDEMKKILNLTRYYAATEDVTSKR